MSFDKVQLPSSVIADLYKQSLVVLDDAQATAVKQVTNNSALPAGGLQVKSDEMIPEHISKDHAAVVELSETGVAKPLISYLGGFKQQVSIVIAEPNYEHILPEDLKFLEKMMAACKLTVDDMAIINVATNQPAAQQLWQLMPAKVVLMFDVPTSAIGIPFYQPDFKVQHWDNARFLNAPPLAAFRGNDTPELKALKRQLWEALQKIFLEK